MCELILLFIPSYNSGPFQRVAISNQIFIMRKNKIDKPNLPTEGQATTKTDINVPLQSNISIEEAFRCEKSAVSLAIDFKIITLLEDKTFSFSNAKFNSSGQITMQINGIEHT